MQLLNSRQAPTAVNARKNEEWFIIGIGEKDLSRKRHACSIGESRADDQEASEFLAGVCLGRWTRNNERIEFEDPVGGRLAFGG